MSEEEVRSRFPLKKCLIATLVIILCAFIVLTLLYSIVQVQKQNDKYWIFLLVWGVVFAGIILFYWCYQIIKYCKNRKDEK